MNPRCNEERPPLVTQALEQFNTADFYAAHEALEEAWGDESQSIRRLYQGILQVAVGFYHLTNLNYNGAIAMLQTGADTLEAFSPRCQGIEVATFIDAVRAYRIELVARGRDRVAEYDPGFPLIEYQNEGMISG